MFSGIKSSFAHLWSKEISFKNSKTLFHLTVTYSLPFLISVLTNPKPLATGAKTLTSTMDKETAKKAGSVFDGPSNTKLEKQLNEVVKAMLPKEFPVPQMKLADVRFLKGAVSNFKTGKEAGIEIQNENRFIAAVIASIYVRMNGLTYNMTSKAKIHKAEAK